ncbi:MAG: CoA pyrophosphatase [Betaproteobacteria bacterium]|nr:CoA pyrophosphatase [Betaproteobacteria bacterium]
METASIRNPDTSWLRARFSQPTAARAVRVVADLPAAEIALRAASVLIPVIERDAGLTVLFTRRTDHLQAHAGQISFPGGGAEPADASPIATALRETEEEIGLHPRHIEILGSLEEHPTVTGYRVTPVVGLVAPPFDLRLDEFEVAEIFEVPLAFLLDPVNHRRDSMIREGRRREFDAVPYGPHYIWGATAAMLLQLHAYLSSEP